MRALLFAIPTGTVSCLVLMGLWRLNQWWDTRKARRDVSAWLERLEEWDAWEAQNDDG